MTSNQCSLELDTEVIYDLFLCIIILPFLFFKIFVQDLARSEDWCDHEGDSLDGGDGGGVEPQLDPHVHLLVSGL